jgi:uncharacterized membrane protein
MKGSTRLPLLAVLFCVAVFILWTSQSLPDVPASHFGASGSANGYMPKGLYVVIMLAFAVALPLLLGFLPILAMEGSTRGINLPNRDYWLAPEHRQETVRVLQGYMAHAALVVALFMAYVHWLVIDANRQVPPHLALDWMVGGLAFFVLATLAWSLKLVMHFRNVGRNPSRTD